MSERKEPDATLEEDRFATKARELFEQSVDELDGETMSRLNRARQAAIAELGRKSYSPFRPGQWVPAAGVAAAAAIAVALWSGNDPVDPVAVPETLADFELLLAEDSFEMLEDLEFYAWIDLDGDGETLEPTDGNVG